MGVRFMLGGHGPNEVARTVCIINSHLNAHTHNVKRRQADYESICNRMVFFSDKPLSAVTPPHNLEALKSLIAHDTEDAAPALADDANGTEGANNDKVEQAQAQAAQAEKLDGLRPLEHDLVIWLGDLNYRIELSRDDIISAALAHDWERLHRADQLRYGRGSSRNALQQTRELICVRACIQCPHLAQARDRRGQRIPGLQRAATAVHAHVQVRFGHGPLRHVGQTTRARTLRPHHLARARRPVAPPAPPPVNAGYPAGHAARRRSRQPRPTGGVQRRAHDAARGGGSWRRRWQRSAGAAHADAEHSPGRARHGHC